MCDCLIFVLYSCDCIWSLFHLVFPSFILNCVAMRVFVCRHSIKQSQMYQRGPYRTERCEYAFGKFPNRERSLSPFLASFDQYNSEFRRNEFIKKKMFKNFEEAYTGLRMQVSIRFPLFVRHCRQVGKKGTTNAMCVCACMPGILV